MSNKLAIIGVGAWGINHARVASTLRAMGYISDAIVMDIDEERVKYVSKLYGLKYALDFEKILRDDEIKYAIVASPPRYHYEQTIQLLNAGKNVLVEKPMAETSEQALELVDIAKRNNRILMTGFLLRYSPAVQFLKKKYMENRENMGDILLVYSKRINPSPKREIYIGVIKDLAIHDIDLTMFLFDCAPRYVYAFGRRNGSALEYMSVINVHLENKHDKFCLLVETSRASPYKFRRFEVMATKAVTILDLTRHTVEIYSESSILKPRIPIAEPLFEEDKNFILSSNNAETPLVSGVDGYRALLVCDKALESLEKNSIIEIPKFEV